MFPVDSHLLVFLTADSGEVKSIQILWVNVTVSFRQGLSWLGASQIGIIIIVLIMVTKVT